MADGIAKSAPADLARDIRRIVLEESRRAGVGHIGSGLSIADIVAALYAGPLADVRIDDPARDRFVLSKGHAALAVYAALFLNGSISRSQLETYCADDSYLGVHPEHQLPGIDISTGSLGHGLSIAAGSALAARVQGSARRVFALLSDAECNEGSVWEAAMFASHHRLANLVAIIDLNGQQALGYTRDVLDLDSMAGRWQAFGWDIIELDGHDPQAMIDALDRFATEAAAAPHVIVARTVFGKGVSFMESQIKWHYMPITPEEFDAAIREIGQAS